MLDNKPRIMYIEFLLQRFRIHQLLKFDQPIPVVNCEKSDSGKNVQPYAQVFRALMALWVCRKQETAPEPSVKPASG